MDNKSIPLYSNLLFIPSSVTYSGCLLIVIEWVALTDKRMILINKEEREAEEDRLEEGKLIGNRFLSLSLLSLPLWRVQRCVTEAVLGQYPL